MGCTVTPRFTKRLSKKSGLPPGTPVYVGKKKDEQVKVTCIDYDGDHFEEKEVKTIDECFPLKDKPAATWINIDGVHKLDNIEKIGKQFKIHPLVLEDIMHTEQRPKMEDFEDYLFIVLKMFQYDEKENETKPIPILIEDVTITVFPREQLTQIQTNEVNTKLSFMVFIFSIFTVIGVFVELWFAETKHIIVEVQTEAIESPESQEQTQNNTPKTPEDSDSKTSESTSLEESPSNQ